MKTMIRLAAASAVALVAAPTLAAGPNASDYNLFVTGNMTATGSDTEGAVAVGGNATLNGYSVGALPRGGRTDLVVGGNADLNGGSTAGKIAIAGDAKFRSYGVGAGLAASDTNLQVGGTVTAPSYITTPNPPIVAPAVLPIDIAAEGLRLQSLSTTLGARTATGSFSSVSFGGLPQLTLTGANAGLNIFSLTAAEMSNWSDFTLNIPVGATALINVSGTAAAVVGGRFHYGSGASNSSVLFNFYQATSLGFGNVDMSGSVLAPFAAYTPGGVTGLKMGWDGGVVNGQVFVASWNQTDYKQTQVNSRFFSGDLLDPSALPPPGAAPIPEPGSWAMMILGFGLVGGLMRRPRGTRAAA